MLRNYVAVALRNLHRNKGYAFINVAGLAVGLACFILIGLFVQHELSYDSFYPNADRIHRVVKRHPGSNFHGLDEWAVTPAQLASTLVQEFPQVTAATSIKDQNALLSLRERHFWEKGLWADAHFFNVFSLSLLEGNPKTALSQPNSIVLSESLARKLFREAEPIGQALLYEKRDAYTVTGVMRDLPENSSLKYAFVTSLQSQSQYVEDIAANRWNSSWCTFFVLADGADGALLQAGMPALIEKYLPDSEKEADPARRVQYHIQPLSEVHLHSKFIGELAFTGNITYVYLFSAIAFVILLLACVNYTNLAVARSIKRAREVGMRKVVGAFRGQLLRQFLGESVLMTFLALLVGLGIVHLILPLFRNLMERPITMDYLGNGLLLPGLLVLVLLVGLVSGSYPAFFMAALRPMQVLVGKSGGRASRFRMQRVLIVGQYAVSIALVTGSFVVYEQMQYMQDKNVGYDRDHVITVQVHDEALRENYSTVREEWLRDPRVLAVSASSALPTYFHSSNGIRVWDGSSEGRHLEVYIAYADYDFLDVFGIELAAGRTFSRQISSDTLGAALINEKAASALGWTPQEAVGKHFTHNNGERTIVGVVRDFHTQSMHQPIEPTAIRLQPGGMGYISVKVRSDNLPGTIGLIERAVKQFTPYPFEYRFLDEHFDQLYKAELRLGETFGFFTILALLIASMGLFGLAAFTAEQRTKEVGIRKVLGANVAGLVALLSKDFLGVVGIAFILATPLAYFVMQRWLEDFAYRIEMGPSTFLLPGGLALAIALATVSYQAVRAAMADPVKSLRYE